MSVRAVVIPPILREQDGRPRAALQPAEQVVDSGIPVRIEYVSPCRLPLFLQLVQLVVHRLKADPEFRGCGGFVAAVLFQNAQDMFHFNLS